MGLNPDNFSLSAEEVTHRLRRQLGTDEAETQRILEAYRTAEPDASPSDLLAAIATDFSYVRNTMREADLQATGSSAPVYAYLFTWQTPAMDGLLRAPHTAEVPFIFGSTEAAAPILGNSPEIAPMTEMMMATWSAFAHTGNPNNALLPEWPVYETEGRRTMLLDLNARVESGPGRTTRAALDAVPFYEYSNEFTYQRP